MDLHLINGFLGSGKTTAIIAAAKEMIQAGKKVGIVTNDKGQFQVDTAFFQSNNIATRQVTGGCFRCSFSEFEDKIAQLQESTFPDVIFAESVGSCVDLVNTIFSPLQQNDNLNFNKMTFSVYVDIRLFQRWVNNITLPFSERIIYLFRKQIEEGEFIILNKSDLLSSDEKKDVLTIATRKFPEKEIFLQNSLNPSSVKPWLNSLSCQEPVKAQPGFVVDYSMYKGGEKEMAWFDQKLVINSVSPKAIKPAVINLITLLLASLQKEEVFIGHIKLFLSTSEGGTKISFTTADFLELPGLLKWKHSVPEVSSTSISVMLNARVAMKAEEFEKIVKHAVYQIGIDPQIHVHYEEGSSYNPQMSMNRP